MKREPDFISNNNKLWDKNGRQSCLRGITFSFSNETEQKSSALSLSLENADKKLAQLSKLGYNLISLQIFWKQIEPLEPEEYNEEYLAQLRLLLKKIEEYNFYVIIQPVMGNWGSGLDDDGCPAWTLKLLDLDPQSTQKIFQDSLSLTDKNTKLQVALFKIYLSSTMYTLFWAGKTFTPDFLVEGENVQEYLQKCYISAMKHMARRIKDCDAVIGISFMSQAEVGFVGVSDLHNITNYTFPFEEESLSCNISFFDLIKNASGLEATYKTQQKIKLGPLTQLSQQKLPFWEGGFSEGKTCLWEKIKIWHKTETQESILDEPEYFSLKTPDAFIEDYLKPFQKDFYDAFQKKHGRYLFLSEALTNGTFTSWEFGNEELHKKIQAAEKEGGVIPEYDPEAEKIISGYEINFSELTSQINPEIKGSCAPLFLLNLTDALKGKVGHKAESFVKFFDFASQNNISFLVQKNLFMQKTPILIDEIQNDLAKPFIKALWGTLTNFSIKKKPSPIIELEWMSLPQSLDQVNSTEIFIPDLFFTQGWKVEKFDGVGTVSCQPEKQTLLITTVTEQRCTLRIISK